MQTPSEEVQQTPPEELQQTPSVVIEDDVFFEAYELVAPDLKPNQELIPAKISANLYQRTDKENDIARGWKKMVLEQIDRQFGKRTFFYNDLFSDPKEIAVYIAAYPNMNTKHMRKYMSDVMKYLKRDGYVTGKDHVRYGERPMSTHHSQPRKKRAKPAKPAKPRKKRSKRPKCTKKSSDISDPVDPEEEKRERERVERLRAEIDAQFKADEAVEIAKHNEWKEEALEKGLISNRYTSQEKLELMLETIREENNDYTLPSWSLPDSDWKGWTGAS